MYLTFHGKERFTISAAHHGDHEPASSDVIYDVHVSADSHEDEHHSGGQPGVLHHPPKESPWVVTVPLILLAIPSLLIGYVTVAPMLFGNWFGSAIHVDEANNVLAELGHEFHGAAVMALHGFTQLPFLLVVVAFVICTYVYLFNPKLADRIKSALKPLWTVLDRKYWADEVEYALFASGGVRMGRLFWKYSDAGAIDGVAVNGSVHMIHRGAALLRRLQTGYLYHYAFAMIIGVIVLFGGYRLFGN
jgi:NADH-quinone oxidoreductase subunit L